MVYIQIQQGSLYGYVFCLYIYVYNCTILSVLICFVISFSFISRLPTLQPHNNSPISTWNLFVTVNHRLSCSGKSLSIYHGVIKMVLLLHMKIYVVTENKMIDWLIELQDYVTQQNAYYQHSILSQQSIVVHIFIF